MTMDHSMDSSVVSEGVRSPDLSNQSVRRISPASSFALHSSSELNPSGESAWFVGEDASASVNPQGIDNYGDRIGDQGIGLMHTKIRSTKFIEESRSGASQGIRMDSVLSPVVNPIGESTSSSRRHRVGSQISKSIIVQHNKMHLPSTNEIHFQTNHNSLMMPRAVTPEVAVLRAVNPARPKSESIAIKRSRVDEDSFHSEHSTERMYDWATWRMYHRITNARRTRVASVSAEVTYKGESSILRVPPMPPAASMTTSHQDDDHTPQCISSLDYSDQGEVFEIEI